jgi:replication-associated recombination protein RarA
MSTLYNKYHPRDWQGVCGQDKPLATIRSLLARGASGRVFWLTANAGQGKTAIANLIAHEASKDWAIEVLDAQDVTLDSLREYSHRCRCRAIDGSIHVLIVNEAHTLRRAVVDYLKTLVESPEFQANGLMICTTTISEQAQRSLFGENESGAPFLSRAHEITLNHGPELELAFALKARSVAQLESLDGRPLTDYVDLVRKCKCNLRMVYQKIEEGAMLD